MQNTKDVYKCCFTGYRPQKMPFKLSRSDGNFVDFENKLLDGIMSLVGENCKIFYTGMAMGFDILAAENILLLKKAMPNLDVKLVCVIPFESQNIGYSAYWQKKYNFILENADEKIILSEKYYSGCYQVRNKYMVDNCDFVLTWYDGKAGGTRNTLDYAVKQGRQIFNINMECENFAVQTCFQLI